MHWLYLLVLTVVLSVVAGFLRKVDQVYSIAALSTSFISLIWGFSWAPSWVQLLISGLLFGLYRLYILWLNLQSRQTFAEIRRKRMKSRVSVC